MNSNAYPYRLTVPVDEETREALRALARKEMREARFQAGILLREALERRGLIEPLRKDPNADQVKRERAD